MTRHGITILTPPAIGKHGWLGYAYELWRGDVLLERSTRTYRTPFDATMHGWNRVNKMQTQPAKG